MSTELGFKILAYSLLAVGIVAVWMLLIATFMCGAQVALVLWREFKCLLKKN